MGDSSKSLFKSRSSANAFNMDIGKMLNNDFSSLDEDDEEILVDIPEGFKLLANAFNSNIPNIRDVFKYAIKRGVSKHKIWLLRLGYSNNNEFSRCLIIPSFDIKGNINYYTARKIDVDTNCGYKYKNANVPKKNIIFNELNIDWNIPLTLVEGPLDLLKTNDNATCLLGSSLTEDMSLFQNIVKNKTEVNLALDEDAYYKSIKIASLLANYDIKVNILDTRGNYDVGDMTHEYFIEILDNAKEFKTEDVLINKIKQL